MVPAFVTSAADNRGVGHERIGGYRNEISRVDEAAPSVEMSSTKRKLPNGHWGACQQQTTHFVRKTSGHTHTHTYLRRMGAVPRVQRAGVHGRCPHTLHRDLRVSGHLNTHVEVSWYPQMRPAGRFLN